MEYEQRKQIVETEYAYLPNGLKANFVGYADPHSCGLHSAMPGGFSCSWDKALEVIQRPDRRFKKFELSRNNSPWNGLVPDPEDFQTPEDYDRVVNSNACWWEYNSFA